MPTHRRGANVGKRTAVCAIVTVLSLASVLGLTARPAAAAGVWRYVNPGDWVPDVVAAANPGDSVVLRAGTYPSILLRGMSKGGVTLRGIARADVTVQGVQIMDSSGITVSTMNVTSSPVLKASAVRVQGTSSNIALRELTLRPTYAKGVSLSEQVHHVTIDKNTIDGSKVVNTTGRGIYVEGQGDSTNWPHDITISNNEIFKPYMDTIFIGGARNVTIDKNYIHDLQANAEHNDGVQVTKGINLRITRNYMISPGATPEPDQGIILGVDAGSTTAVIADVYVANNVIRDWRGTGIVVAGASNVKIVNNSIARTGSPTYKSASIASSERTGYPNPSMAVWNNLIESVYTAGGTIAYEDYNCVQKDGRGAHDITADPQIADKWNLKLADTSPCVSAGLARDDNPLVDFSGATRPAGAVTIGAWG